MLPSQVKQIPDETTEKTIEVNLLSEFVKLFLPKFIVTIIGPSRRQERYLGFDDILVGLPLGYTLAFQFKAPFLRIDGCPRFILDVSQLQVLLNRFKPKEAFFVLAPFTRTREFIAAHHSGTLLQRSTLIDVHDIPFPAKKTQSTRTLKYLGSQQIQITDPWKYLQIKKTWSFEELTAGVMEGKIGRKGPVMERQIPRAEKRGYGGPNYYVHVTRRESRTESTEVISYR